jgi:hypothetical protein
MRRTANLCAAHEAGNSEAARVILADVAKHGGPEALCVQWAKRYVARAGLRPEPEEHEAPSPPPGPYGQQGFRFEEASQ